MSADTAIALLTQRVETLHADIGEMRTTMGKIADALTTLALVEERQNQTGQALERAFKALGKLEDRLDALERHAPLQAQTSEWVVRALWAAAAAGAVFVAKKVGLL